MAHPLIRILPHIFLLYAALFSMTGIHILAVIVSFGLTAALYIYKLPKSTEADSEEVLLSNTSIIAHRGAGNDAPENTLAAIRLAKKNGAEAVEFDVDYTSDGEAVVFHDDTVDRTTDGTGAVNHMTFERIRKLNASANFGQKERFPNEQVPSLEEAVRLCLDLNLKMYIDVKGNAPKSAEVISSLFKKYPEMYKNAIVCSFFPWIVYMVKRRDTKITTGLTHRHRFITRKVDGTEREGPWWQKLTAPIADTVLEWAHYSWLWYLCGNSAFLACNRDVSQKLVDHFNDRGIHVVVWTVNSPVEKSFVKDVLQCSYITDTLSKEGCGSQKN